MNPRRRLLLFSLAAAALAMRAEASTRPTRLLVPGDAGGVIDIRARWLSPRLSTALKRPVIVENHPGAAGNIGMRAGASSPRDGSTIIVVHQGTMAINPHLYASPGYDALGDFIPLTRLGYGPLVVAVPASSPAGGIAQLVALARQRTLFYGSPGVGSPPHLAAELFKRRAGIDATHVPYKGGGQALSDLIAGQLDFAIEGPTIVKPQVDAGRLRALATTGAQRLSIWPALPVARESIQDFEYLGWAGLALPSGTPQDVVSALHEALMRVLLTEEADQWFAERGASVGAQPAKDFAEFIRAEHRRWGELIREAGLLVQ